MPSSFPGMDPYLEGTAWESFHAALVDEMGRQLAPKVRPRYFVRVERVPRRSLAIFDAVERRLVVAIELLSPSNKRVGGGREEYLERRDNYLNSDVHLIEIDLLRRGTRLPMRGVLPSVPYFAFLSRSGLRPMTGVWPIGLREPLPEVPVPPLAGDPDVILDLQAALNGAYDAFGFDLELDYRQPPQVPLAADDATWTAALLAGRGQQ